VSVAALHLCYLGLDDALVHTQVLPYLRALAGRGYEMHLLTFESAEREPAARDALAEELRASGVRWHERRYHRRPSLPATLYDVVVGAWTAFRLMRRHRIRLLHARSHVGAAMALPLRVLFGVPFLFDVRGLLPDEYADAGHWRRGGLKYRLGKAMERVFLRRARQVVVLTETTRDDLVRADPMVAARAADLTVIPCCVDLAAYREDEAGRARERAERGWDGRCVLVFVGKLGLWSLDAEMARFFAAAYRADPRFVLHVLTPTRADVLRRTLDAESVPPESYRITAAAPRDVPAILRAADAGLMLVQASVGRRSSSPTKMGEYLASGLPVVATRGIGDCDRMLGGGRGVLLDGLDREAYTRAAAALLELVDDPATRARCRAFAAEELSLERVGGPRYASVYARMLDPEAGP
jgi:glycosyltransferase involved in cell wall biosynthesis